MKKTKRFWAGLACLALLGGVGVEVTSFAVANAPSSIGMVKAAAATATMDKFTSTSGNMDGYISYVAEKGSASNAPAVYNGEIRVYQNGGLFTVNAKESATLTKVTLGSSMATTVTYTTDKTSKASSSISIDKNEKTTVTLSAGEKAITFNCTGTSKTSRLYINYLSVEYDNGESLSPVVTAGYTGTPATQFDGTAFNPKGLEFYTEHEDGSKRTKLPESFTFSPSTLSLGDTEVTATLIADPSISFKIPVTVNENSNYSLCFDKIGDSGWGSNYAKQTVVTGKYTVSFSAANKSSQYITDCPVTKGANGDAVFSLNDSSKAFNSFSLTIKQWETKTNTFEYALGDGMSFGDAVAVPALTYDSDKLATFEVTIPADKNVKQIKVKAKTGQNQFGWYGFSATAKDAPAPTAEEWASHFLKQTSSPCADGKNNSAASEALNAAWAASKGEFERLAADGKAEVKNAVANDAGTQLQQAVARYDFIVKKYGAENFADRAVSAPGANIINGTTGELSASVAVAALGLTGAVAIGSYFFLRKKKQF